MTPFEGWGGGGGWGGGNLKNGSCFGCVYRNLYLSRKPVTSQANLPWRWHPYSALKDIRASFIDTNEVPSRPYSQIDLEHIAVHWEARGACGVLIRNSHDCDKSV